ncbi:hypothetical protein SAMN04488030_0941 [Aliiroseovarius halocynthiae]|nr:hypothetical protein SAMN04488030_0941 [Aliiroseovarius halocynthiae]
MNVKYNILKTGDLSPVLACCYCMTMPDIPISFVNKGVLT